MTPHTKAWPTAILVVLLAAACGRTPETKHGEPQVKRQVTLHTVRLASVPDYVEAFGQVRAKNSSVLSAKVTGYIRAVHVREGQAVRAGQVLVEADAPELGFQTGKAEAGAAEAAHAEAELDHALQAADAALQAAEAQAALAGETYSRFKTLRAKESVSRQEYDEAEARHVSAQAQLQQARESRSALAAKRPQIQAKIRQAQSELSTAQSYLSYLTIVAPYDGLVVRRYVDPGMLATPGLPLVTIEDASTLQLVVSVPESYRWSMVDGPVLATVASAAIERVPTTPAEAPASADPVTRTFTYKLTLPRSEKLRSGMFGSAYFPLGVHEALQIPAAALVRLGQLDGVFVCDTTERAVWRLVKIGKRVDGSIEVFSGVQPGERVVIDPPPGLASGEALEVQP